jgi:rfaE bifunctional protein nucleotidyltransferase chain/domain
MFKRFFTLLRARGPWRRALILAALSDAVSFGMALAVPIQVAVDALTAVALFALLGFRLGLLIPLVIEAIPGLAAFPTWTLAIGAMMALEKPMQAEDKILSRKALAQAVTALKTKGKKVVFTNGVFDLLHVGHLRYLKQARALGDALVIGLNSDGSVKRLKGDNRPILPEAERAELLAGLDCVDYVCIFPEDDPRELIKAAVPDILVKGGDWPVDKILGADTVQAAGGKVMSLPFVEGRSTTSIVESIASRYGKDFKE